MQGLSLSVAVGILNLSISDLQTRQKNKDQDASLYTVTGAEGMPLHHCMSPSTC